MARPVYTPHALISSRWLFWIATAFALVMLAPVLWLIGLALKNGRDLTGGTLAVFGGPYALDNFADIFKSGPLPVWFFNSLVVATGQTLGPAGVFEGGDPPGCPGVILVNSTLNGSPPSVDAAVPWLQSLLGM